MSNPIVVTVDNRVRVPRAAGEAVLTALKEDFEHKNPELAAKRAIGIPTWNIPTTIKTWASDGEDGVSFPRGGMARVRARLREHDIPFKVVDARTEGAPSPNFPKYSGDPLRDYQHEVVDVILEKEQGIVRAPVGCGKTTIAFAAIAKVGLNALVILPTGGLFKQWADRAAKELGLRGDRLKELGLRGDRLGMIRGSTWRLRPVTIAMQQTLAQSPIPDNVREFFGHILIDECFPRGTPILMEDGTLRSIEDICAGEQVAVGGTVIGSSSRVYDGPLHRVGAARATGGHPVGTLRGWIAADSVVSHDIVLCDPMHKERVKSSGGQSPRVRTYGAGLEDGKRARDDLPPFPRLNGAPLPDLRRGFCNALRLQPSSAEHSGEAPIHFEGEVFNLMTERSVYVAGGVLVHNCQLAAARTYVEVVDQFPARYRIAVSADNRRKDRKEFLTHDLFSDVICEIDQERVTNAGHVVEVEIRVVLTDFRADWYGQGPGKYIDFNKLLEEMTTDAKRNELACRFIHEEVRAGEQSIMLTARREHARTLDRFFVERKVPSGYFLGDMVKGDEEEFERTRKGILNGSVNVGVGTYKALGFGIDLPAVTVGMAVTPIASNPQQFNQVRGRLCRPNPSAGKTQGRFYVLWDSAIYGNHLDIILAHNKTVTIWDGRKFVDAREWRKRKRASGKKR